MSSGMLNLGHRLLLGFIKLTLCGVLLANTYFYAMILF